MKHPGQRGGVVGRRGRPALMVPVVHLVLEIETENAQQDRYQRKHQQDGIEVRPRLAIRSAGSLNGRVCW